MTKHRMSKTAEYRTWQRMKARCLRPTHPDFPNYGGAGITIAPEWMNDFLAFLDHVGPKPSPAHSIDRIQGHLGYHPGNVRWATPKMQSENRPGFVKDVNGMTAVEAAKESGIVPSTLYRRLAVGMPMEKALSSSRLPSGADPRMLTINGETLPLKAWARKVGLKASTVRARLKRGWAVERALTQQP